MIKNNFSEKIKELRLRYKYTQKYIAKYLGITARQYQYCERGHIPSEYNIIIKICKLYDIDANELFGIEKINIYPKTEKVNHYSKEEFVELAKICEEMDYVPDSYYKNSADCNICRVIREKTKSIKDNMVYESLDVEKFKEVAQKYDLGKVVKEMFEKDVYCPSISESLVDFNLSNGEKNINT